MRRVPAEFPVVTSEVGGNGAMNEVAPIGATMLATASCNRYFCSIITCGRGGKEVEFGLSDRVCDTDVLGGPAQLLGGSPVL